MPRVDAQRLGGLEVDHQLELGRPLHGKVADLRTFEYAVDIERRAAKQVGGVDAVGDQAAAEGEIAEWIDSRQAMPGGERHDFLAMDGVEEIGQGDQAAIRRGRECRELGRELGAIADGGDDRLDLQARGGRRNDLREG